MHTKSELIFVGPIGTFKDLKITGTAGHLDGLFEPKHAEEILVDQELPSNFDCNVKKAEKLDFLSTRKIS